MRDARRARRDETAVGPCDSHLRNLQEASPQHGVKVRGWPAGQHRPRARNLGPHAPGGLLPDGGPPAERGEGERERLYAFSRRGHTLTCRAQANVYRAEDNEKQLYIKLFTFARRAALPLLRQPRQRQRYRTPR